MIRINLLQDKTFKNTSQSKRSKIIVMLGLCVVAAISLLACNNKNYDKSLDGMWVGKTEITTGLIKAQETYIFEFKNEELRISKSQNSTNLNGQKEIESGTYEVLKNQNVIEFNVKESTCANQLIQGKVDRPTKTTFSYIRKEAEHDVPESLAINLGLGKTLQLSRVLENERKENLKILENYTMGCYVERENGTMAFVQDKLNLLEKSVQKIELKDDKIFDDNFDVK